MLTTAGVKPHLPVLDLQSNFGAGSATRRASGGIDQMGGVIDTAGKSKVGGATERSSS
jgi:hypothetical protein